MRTLAYFGIESSGLSLAVDLLILFVAVLYLSLIYWTYADARRRIVDPMLVACATAASLFPFVGTIIYLVLRPPEYLEDVRERELETQAAQARLHQLDETLCPHCSYRIEPDFIRCPSCLRKLKERCTSCSRPLDRAWTICPYCEADVPGLSGTRSRRRRTAESEPDSDVGELDVPAVSADGPPRSRRRRAASSGRDSDLSELDVAAASGEGATEVVEPALASEPAPARPRRPAPPGGRSRPSS
ncbi:MAG TPA: zinc ribbon domain-containing protein [Solirubrobacteraceae bacterium]|nr:zinc ribbon domain-containing protein [Solirubrobacteraceae bacterium]